MRYDKAWEKVNMVVFCTEFMKGLDRNMLG